MYSVALIALLVVGSSQAIRFGKCPQLPTQPDFNPARYLGIWYEIESYGNLMERIKNKCPEANYTSEGDNIRIRNQGISTWSGKPTLFTAIAEPDGDISNGKLKVHIKGLFGNFTAPYWVLSTDYDTYSVVWSCVQYPKFYIDYSWIMTRVRSESLPVELNDIVDGVLESVSIPRSRYVDAKQLNCKN